MWYNIMNKTMNYNFFVIEFLAKFQFNVKLPFVEMTGFKIAVYF